MINPNQLGRSPFPASASQWMLVGLRTTTPATGYSLNGPEGGEVGLPSSNFTVALTGGTTVPSPVTITPSDGGGGTFTPSTVVLNTGSTSATFTYTPVSVGVKTISTTNNRGLPNPSSLGYISSAGVHLLTTLISYWKLDETGSAARVDSQGINTLTVSGVVGSTTGKITYASQFFGAENLNIVSNSTLQVTGDFTFSCWVKNNTAMTFSLVFAKAQGTVASLEYLLIYDDTNGFRWVVGDTGGATSTVAGVGSAATVSIWYHIVCWYDSSDKKARMRINDATTYVAPTGITSPLAAAAGFTIGSRDDIPTPGFYIGLVDEVGFWKRKLTVAEITALYNGGSGLPFSSFTS